MPADPADPFSFTPGTTADANQVNARFAPLYAKLNEMRTIRGTVSSAGVIVVGAGFSVARNAVGDYTITYSTAFSAAASVVACANASAGIFASYVSAGTGSVRIFTSSGAGALLDVAFSFVAIGPS